MLYTAFLWKRQITFIILTYLHSFFQDFEKENSRIYIWGKILKCQIFLHKNVFKINLQGYKISGMSVVSLKVFKHKIILGNNFIFLKCKSKVIKKKHDVFCFLSSRVVQCFTIEGSKKVLVKNFNVNGF